MMLIQQQQNAQEAVLLGRSPLLYIAFRWKFSLWVHDVNVWILDTHNIYENDII